MVLKNEQQVRTENGHSRGSGFQFSTKSLRLRRNTSCVRYGTRQHATHRDLARGWSFQPREAFEERRFTGVPWSDLKDGIGVGGADMA